MFTDVLVTTAQPQSCLVAQRDGPALVRLRNGMPSVSQRSSLMLSDSVTGQHHIAPSGDGTATILPGYATGLRCATDVHPDSRLIHLHNGAIRYVTGLPIPNRTS